VFFKRTQLMLQLSGEQNFTLFTAPRLESQDGSHHHSNTPDSVPHPFLHDNSRQVCEYHKVWVYISQNDCLLKRSSLNTNEKAMLATFQQHGFIASSFHFQIISRLTNRHLYFPIA
jgi:hypothetical protein